MLDFIIQHFLSSVAGWLGLTGIVVVVMFAVAWFIPPLRPYAIAAAGTMIAFATIYTKGSRDRAALEKRRKDEAVKRAQADYAAIDKRPDEAEKRLKDGTF